MMNFKRTMLSPDHLRRAVIYQRPDGFYLAQFEHYDDSTVAAVGGFGDPYWRVDDEAIVTATLEEAERKAADLLGLAPA